MNDQQYAAAHDESPEVCVASGPGTGKTTTLVEAVNFNRENDWCEAPERIWTPRARSVVITFTNSGAKVLKERIGEFTEYIGTIHGFCMKIIRATRPRMSLIDERSADRLLASVSQQLGYKGSNKELQDARKNYWSKQQKLGSYTPAERVVLAYASRLIKEELVEYDMLLARALFHVRSNIIYLPVKFFIDERQDCADVDMAIINSYPHRKIFAVGDVDQCLYEFRGANPRNMVDFYKSASSHILDRNYRSSPQIVRAANQMIRCNKTRVPLELKTDNPPSPYEPRAVMCSDATAHDMEVSNLVSFFMNEGMAANEIAILCRTNEQVAQMCHWLSTRGIKTASRRSEVIPDLSRVRTLIGLALKPTSEVLHEIEQSQRHSKIRLDTPVITSTMGLAGWLAKQHNCSDPMAAQLKRAFSECPEKSPENILEYLRDYEVTSEENNGVMVGTMHWAKGQEFEAVIIAHADEEIGVTASEEERRLYYVAITRAKKAVVAVGMKRRYVQFLGWMDRAFVSCIHEAGMH